MTWRLGTSWSQPDAGAREVVALLEQWLAGGAAAGVAGGEE